MQFGGEWWLVEPTTETVGHPEMVLSWREPLY